MRLLLISALVSTALFSIGCTAMDAGGDVAKSTAGIFTPNRSDYGDTDAPAFEDNWTDGRNARADRASTKLNDPIGKFWTSDKAKSIEENVGVQYQ